MISVIMLHLNHLLFVILIDKKIIDPWTDTSHYFTFYENPEITQIYPTEGKTSVTTEVFISSSKKNPFSTRKQNLI